MPAKKDDGTRRPRALTVPIKTLKAEAKRKWKESLRGPHGEPPPEEGIEDEDPLDVIDLIPRPHTRKDCANIPRPCPFVGCRYHLAIDVSPAGSIKYNFPDTTDLSELTSTCALDVAEEGGITLDETGKMMNLTRERVRQIENSALRKVKIHEDLKDED